MLLAFGALLVGINVLSALSDIHSERAAVEHDALRDFSNLTGLLAEQTAQSLESVDQLLDAAVSDMKATGIGDAVAREARLRDRISGMPQLRALLLLGPDGRVVVSTDSRIPGGLDLADRTYFATHRYGDAAGRFVSDPFRGRASGEWEFALSERIVDSEGRFAGVLAALIDVAYFDRLYRSLDVGAGGFVGLVTAGGTAITRVPGPREALERLVPDTGEALTALRREGRFAGWLAGPVEDQPARMLVSAAATPRVPLNIIVGSAESAVLAPWRAKSLRIGLRALLGSAVVVALIALAARELARRARSDERVRESEERYALAVAGANDGIWDHDLVADRVYGSRRALELLGIDPALEGVRTFAEWERLLHFHPDDLPRRQAARAAHIAGETPFYEGEWRVRQADGAYRWVKIRGLCIRDAEGRATRFAGSVTDIETRKRDEEALRSRQKMIDLAQQAAQAAAFEWRIGAGAGQNRWSADLEAMLGLARGSYDGTFETWKTLVHAEDWPLVQVAIERATQSGDVATEYRVVRGDGTMRWLQAKGRVFFDAEGRPVRMVGFMLDVTDRRQAEAELQRQRALLDELFESAPEAVVLLDVEGRVIRINREFAAVFGYAAEEALGRPIFDLIVPEDELERARALYAVYMSGSRIAIECERRRKDGTRIQVSMLATPILLGGDVIALYAIYRDITERKLAEAEQARLQARLRQAEKMEAVGRLAGGIAHDFNNLLGGILGYAEMVVAEAGEGTPVQRYAHNVLSGANRARDLVDQILTYSRSQRAKRAPVEIDRVVGETLDLVRGSLAAGIVLDLTLSSAPLVVVGDPTQLHQVVMNLCTNALHAMGDSGTLRVALEPVDVATERVLAQGTLAPGRFVRLTMADTGSGMDATTLARIFEPFFTTKEVGRGTGLGLSLVYGIVTDSGGALHVTSEPGRGSTFEIYLPRTEAAAIPATAADAVVPRGNGERVLLVDDEEPLMVMTAEVLAQLGYEAIPFSDGRAALEAFEKTPEGFEVVVTDEVMPALTGTELARRVRRLRPDLPVVLVSGYSGPILTQQALGAGVSGLLKKPVQSRELAAALARALRRAA
ncbi:MAG TPA: PAS domain S-box protein [Burkholderiales bacterium]|nr:PAS domain S-box protein [Burkholderiales bacterium]